MQYRLVLILLISAVMSCKRENQSNNPPPPPPPPPPPAPSVLLKEIVVPSLPSPYYHFEYDQSGQFSFANYASGLLMYDFAHDAGRLLEMQANTIANKDNLKFIYDQTGKLMTVVYADSNGNVFKRALLTYSGNQLVKLERERKSGFQFFEEKTVTLTYYPDGNLRELIEHRPADPSRSIPESTTNDLFENYDNKLNTDAFRLIHNEFFEHLVLLPGVVLQKNNPGKLTRTGDGHHYRIDYIYTYNSDNAPLTKMGSAVFLNPPNNGQTFQSTAFFSYY